MMEGVSWYSSPWCGPAAWCGREPSDKGYGKGWDTQCLYFFCLPFQPAGLALRVLISLRLLAESVAWSKGSLKEGGVKNHLNQLDIHKSVGPGGLHPRVLKELGRSLSSSEGHGSWGRFPVAGKKQTTLTSSRRTISLVTQAGQHNLGPCGGCKATPLGSRFSTHKGQEDGFAEGKSCLIHLIAFYDETMGTMGKGV